MRQLTLLGMTIGAMALLGIGCKSPQEKLEERIQAIRDREAAAVQEELIAQGLDPDRVIDNKPDPSPDVIYLQQVMRNLGKAETFRSTVGVPFEGGKADLSIDFNRAIGLYGRMRIDADDDLSISDVFFSDTASYFRVNTSTWTNITDTDEGNVVKALFRGVTSQSFNANSFVSPYARIEEKTDHESGCTLYAFRQYNEQKARVELYQICVKNDFPAFVVTETPFGPQTVTYSDVNAFVDVQHP
jgi:hypothetical protein